MTTSATPAPSFHALHSAPTPLLLTNVWDAASAALVASSGARAVATSSAGVAWSLGYPDGDILPRHELLDAVARIVAVVDVPVTADIESGGRTPAEVADTVTGVVDAGAVGINIEDGDRSVPDAESRIVAARRAAEGAGAELFINARTDVYLRGLVPASQLVSETVTRARRYLDAGANGIFVPGLADLDVIAELVARIDAPVNIMVGPGSPAVGPLAAVGVRRLSLGSAPAQSAYALIAAAARELEASGTYTSLGEGVDYGRLNALLERS
ncbi:MAG: isocitrate lyase/phosphoenolpyruvate mutase family protein [Microbacterium sp.]|uniref:isocitrate lyase/PEP mutase family protein n=1 Tax=Microbacterium sp. TaxID=51671 RepID=UPI001AC967DD|nr:isocitrate lyase/phosphoenolpyruvate mutase family protein [Microbacterium sp.]MBN9177170.1 isocitrate lyase/phosphoenolpyruvate mutase family protein [Microbacterium sp.]